MSRLSAVCRTRVTGVLWVAIGCIGCALLPSPRITVKTLRSGSIAVDSTGLVFDLPSRVTGAQHPELCMIVDTLHYGFRPRGEAFHALPLTDTTVYPRDAGIQGATPVAIRAVLEGQNGEQVVSNAASYVPGNGMETAYNRRHLLDQSGEEVCWIWEELPAGVTYAKLRLRSTRPIIVHELRWDFVSRA